MLSVLAAGPMQRHVLDSMAPGTYGGQIMRTRYIDDIVTAWAESGQTQLVNLGAGLDTRAYRLHSLARVTVFEADLPDFQRHKQYKLRGIPPTAQEVRYVPIDFNTQPLDQALGAAGFDASRPALFVWEGVTQYLTEAAVRATLTFVGGSAPGSMLVFTYVLPGTVGPNAYQGWSAALKQHLDSTEPWLFGLDPQDLAGFLGPFGLNFLDDVGDAEYQDRYLAPIGQRLLVDPGERVALAIAKPSTTELRSGPWGPVLG